MTTTRDLIPLDHLLASDRMQRAATLYTLLNNGWVELTYRNAEGSRTTRLATRNPAIVRHYAGDSELQALRISDHYTASILYYDHERGRIRSFNTDKVEEIAIPAECPEINH